MASHNPDWLPLRSQTSSPLQAESWRIPRYSWRSGPRCAPRILDILFYDRQSRTQGKSYSNWTYHNTTHETKKDNGHDKEKVGGRLYLADLTRPQEDLGHRPRASPATSLQKPDRTHPPKANSRYLQLFVLCIKH